MAIAEGTPQTIQHQAVLERLITEPYTGSQPLDVVRHVRHRLHAPGYDHVGVPCSHGLSRKHHRLQPRSADLVDGDGRDGRGNPTGNRGLPGRGLALTGHDDVAHDDFVDTRWIDTGSFYRHPDRYSAEFGGGEGREAPEKAADRSAATSEDYCGSSLFTHDRPSSRGVSTRHRGGGSPLI